MRKLRKGERYVLFLGGIIYLLFLPNYIQAQQETVLTGVVRSADDGEPLEGVSVSLIGTSRVTTTDESGSYVLRISQPTGKIRVEYVGYVAQEIDFDKSTLNPIITELEQANNVLDETVVIGYGTTTRRLSTGSVTKISADEIQNQPISNPLMALQGRVSGLEVSPSSGVSGAGVNVKIRGTSSLTQGTMPLVLLNGNPIALDGNAISRLTNASGVEGLSFFNLINPADIASIEVLKDADATAIYGSRGANGVILITTKKATQSGVGISFRADNGVSVPVNAMEMLTTEEYLQMRREAFANSQVEMSNVNAPDIFDLDTTSYLDYTKFLSGNYKLRSDYNFSLQAGGKRTHVGLSAGFNKEKFQVLNDKDSRRFTVLNQVNHRTSDGKFGMDVSVSYANNISNLTAHDPSVYLTLPPHLQLRDEDGNLNWVVNDKSFRSLGLTNPLAEFNNQYTGKFNSLMANLSLDYKFLNGFLIKLTGGYTWTSNQENSIYPSSAIDPSLNTLPSKQLAFGNMQSFIVEPQMSYNKEVGGHNMQVLIGGALQHNNNDNLTVVGNQFVSDLFIDDIANAGNIRPSNTEVLYRYAALFGRLGYHYKSKYLINVSSRTDASSRFGPGRQKAFFYSVGTGWIFSEEMIWKHLFPAISYGKIRASLGTSGNDKIGNYMYLDSWSNMGIAYGGIPAMQPNKLFNADYSWEKNMKTEVALDLGMLNSKILFSATYFKTISDNQLIPYLLPSQTGFTNILRNWDAVIENSGMEILLQASLVRKNHFTWDTKFNITIPKNKLNDFPGLETSSYANRYRVGKSLSIFRLYNYTGIDKETGIYTFEDVNGDGVYNSNDQTTFVEMGARYYGGVLNTFRYKKISAGFLLDFKKQKGLSYIASLSTLPGYNLVNQPKLVLDRWQKPGDNATLQRFTASSSDPAYVAGQRFVSSSGIVVDASYIKVRNFYVNYDLPMSKIGGHQISRIQLMVSIQNLLTYSNYLGGDPEIQNPFITPSPRTLSFGINISI